jgi:cytoskeletal protein CcmA (bactofilin family)
MKFRNNTAKHESNGAFNHTWLGTACKISGNVQLQTPALIDGKIEGEIIAAAPLTIGENAEIAARIKAPSVVVCGRVTGAISARRIEIRPPAVVVGNLSSPVLIVEPGAVLDGHCFMSEDPPDACGLIELTEPVADGIKPHPQQGVSFFITRRQRQDLRDRGYDDAAIDKMTPAEAHKILGLI